MLDYDAARHNMETVQNASKKRDDIKVAKAGEQLEEARRLYEVLNKELHEELPALYDSRIPFYVNTLQTLFSAEATFHQEYTKVYQGLCELTELLAAEAAKGTFQTDANRYLSQAAMLKAKAQQEEADTNYIGSDSSPTTPSKHNFEESLESTKLNELNASNNNSQRNSYANGDNGDVTTIDASTTDVNGTVGGFHSVIVKN